MNRKEEIEVLQRSIAESLASLASAYAQTLDESFLNGLNKRMESLNAYEKERKSESLKADDWDSDGKIG